MMIDNFKEIIPLLNFDSEDDFYHLQIIKRKKEHPDIGSNSIVVKTYYIASVEYLLKKRDEIIALSDIHKARACINLNRRSFERIAFHLLRKVADQIMNKDFRSARKAYESVCGAHSNEPDKRWIIDVDSKDKGYLYPIVRLAEGCKPEGPKLINCIETKNGFHVIIRPFNVQEFKDRCTAFSIQCPDIHKDNPTILYLNF